MKLKKIISILTASVTAGAMLMQSISAAYLYEPPKKNPLSDYYYCVLQLEGMPLSQYEGAKEMGVHDFVLTEEGKAAYETILEEHKKALSKIASFLNTTEKQLDVYYDYTAAINGICVPMRENDIISIRKIKGELGIKNISLSDKAYPSSDTASTGKKYSKEIFNEVDYSKLTRTIADMTGVTETEEKGEGIVIAVIDTEFDTQHEYFSLPENTETCISKEDIEQMRNYMTCGRYISDNCMVSDKIPFAFNYANRNDNTFTAYDSNSSHGTHVAGIAAGNGETVSGDNKKYSFSGVAPNAQLLMLATSYDNNELLDRALLAAYDDALYLDADVINASYGNSIRNIEASDDNIAISIEAIENITDTGVIFSCSAGNESRLSLGEHTDYSTGGDPSQNASAITAATAVNPAILQNVLQTGDGEFLQLKDAQFSISEAMSGKTFDYVMVPGIGNKQDLESLTLEGKIAVINRGTIPFAEKEKNAKSKGAVGVIYVNTKGSSEFVSLSNSLPGCLISFEDGNKLAECKKKTVSFSNLKSLVVDDMVGIDAMSTWGYTEKLNLKPDITGFGGRIYSSVSNITGNHTSYADFSGTSMAAPQITGICALLMQHIKEHPEKYGTVTREERPELVAKLLMSTAEPIYSSKKGELASPRVQGNGLANVKHATETPCYISTYSERDNFRPKLSLGDGYKDKYTLEFNITNIGTEQYTYTPQISLFRDTFDADGNVENEIKRFDSSKEYNSVFTFNGKKITKITVKPNETKTITADITLSEKAFEDIKKDGGAFVDGFLNLSCENVPDLTLAFMAFNGDFDKLSDNGLIREFIYGNIDDLSSTDLTNFSYITDGNFKMGISFLEMVSDTIYVSPNNDGVMDKINPMLFINRRCHDLTIEIKDKNGNTIFKDDNNDGITNLDLYNHRPTHFPFSVSYDFKSDGKAVNNAEYQMIASAKTPLNGQEYSLSQKIVVDTEAPVIKKVGMLHTANDNYYIIEATDNGELNAAAYEKDMAVAPLLSKSGKYIIVPMNDEGIVEVYDLAGNYTSVTDADVSYELTLTGASPYAAEDDEAFRLPMTLNSMDENKEIPDDLLIECVKTPSEYMAEDYNKVNITLDGFSVFDVKPEIGIRGDANYDGEFNIRDAAALARILSDKKDMDDFLDSIAGYLSDYNRDGKVNVRDAAAMAKALAWVTAS